MTAARAKRNRQHNRSLSRSRKRPALDGARNAELTVFCESSAFFMKCQGDAVSPNFRLDTTALIAGLLPLAFSESSLIQSPLRGTAVAPGYNEQVGKCILEPAYARLVFAVGKFELRFDRRL